MTKNNEIYARAYAVIDGKREPDVTLAHDVIQLSDQLKIAENKLASIIKANQRMKDQIDQSLKLNMYDLRIIDKNIGVINDENSLRLTGAA